MTTKNPTETPRKRTRETPDVRQRQILDAALTLMLREDFASITMSDVAREAGVGKGTLYLYFDSKQAILSGLQIDLLSQIGDSTRSLLTDHTLTWTKRLDGLVEAWLRWDIENAKTYHRIFHDHPVPLQEGIDACTKVLIEILKGGKCAGEFLIEDPTEIARFLFHGYSGICFHDHHQEELSSPLREKIDLTTTKDRLQTLFRRVVGISCQK